MCARSQLRQPPPAPIGLALAVALLATSCSGLGPRPDGPADLRIPRTGPRTLTVAGDGRARLDGEIVLIEETELRVRRDRSGRTNNVFVCRLAGERGRIEFVLDGDFLTDDAFAVVDVGAGPMPFVSTRLERNTLADGGAYVRGRLGHRLPAQFEALEKGFPGVETLVLVDVPGGSITEESLAALERLRQRGLETVVPAGGMIASAGVCMCLAGASRRIEQGGRVGVHDWRGSEWRGDEFVRWDGREVSSKSAYHDLLRAHFEAHLPGGADFYALTSAAAGHDGIHWLDRAEIARFGLETDGVP
ncbi:MAG: hypothetical protein AAF726_15315 [Planctomycetota bacterium]